MESNQPVGQQTTKGRPKELLYLENKETPHRLRHPGLLDSRWLHLVASYARVRVLHSYIRISVSRVRKKKINEKRSRIKNSQSEIRSIVSNTGSKETVDFLRIIS